MKSIMKRTAAALCAAVLAVSMLAGCSQTDYSMTAGGEKINAGVYINYLLNEMTSQMYTLYSAQKITDPKDALTQEIDGKNFKTYVKEEAIKQTKEFAAVNAKFDELGLKLSKDDKAAVKDAVNSSWDQSKDFYESEGISKESLTQINEFSYKRTAIFEYYYGEDGIEAVTEDDVKSYLSDNYIRYKQISFSKSLSDDEDTAKTENEEIKATADSYLEQAKAVDYEGFDALIKQHDDEEAAKAAAESEEESDTDSEAPTIDLGLDDYEADSTADTTAEETSESLAEVEDTVSQAEAETKAEETTETVAAETEAPAETTEAAETTDTAAETSEETDSAEVEDLTDESDVDLADVTGDDTAAETDNDNVVNYTTGTDTKSETYDEGYANRLKAIKAATYGEATFYEDDNAYYVIMTADINDKDGYATENRDTLVQEMKSDEFQGLIDGWVKALDIKVNSKAVKRYSVQEVYDRQEEYYSKNS